MSDPQAQLDSAVERYRAHFANRPRVTRDISLLDGILRDLESARTSASGEVLATIDDHLTNWRAEREAIAEAQKGGADAIEAYWLGQRFFLIQQRYRRHYAGQARPTRDRRLLEELVADLKAIQRDMATVFRRFPDDGLSKAQVQVARDIDLYGTELAEIAKARQLGTPTERADWLAKRANDQFQAYRDHFADQQRGSRRIAVLDRIIANLRDILPAMEELKDPGVKAMNEKNAQIVKERIAGFTAEKKRIHDVQARMAPVDRAAALGTAANAIFTKYRDEFRGQDRATRDLAALERMCEQLAELTRDMDEARDIEQNVKNVRVVLEHRVAYEREVQRIREAKSPRA